MNTKNGILKITAISVAALFTFSLTNVNSVSADTSDNTKDIMNLRSSYEKGEIKGSDKILELSTNVFVHGEVTYYNMTDSTVPHLNLNTETDARAKTVEQVLSGEKMEVVKLQDSIIQRNSLGNITPYSRSTPPTNGVGLGHKAYAIENWNVYTSGWQYSNNAYHPTPVGTSAKLYYTAYVNNLYAGGSNVWNSPGSGSKIVVSNTGAGYIGGAYISGLGNITAAWAYNVTVSNDGYNQAGFKVSYP